MSQAHIVLTAMRVGVRYRDIDLAAMTHLPVNEARRTLTLLEKGGLIETAGYYYEKPNKRRKVFSTRQNELQL